MALYDYENPDFLQPIRVFTRTFIDLVVKMINEGMSEAEAVEKAQEEALNVTLNSTNNFPTLRFDDESQTEDEEAIDSVAREVENPQALPEGPTGMLKEWYNTLRTGFTDNQNLEADSEHSSLCSEDEEAEVDEPEAALGDVSDASFKSAIEASDVPHQEPPIPGPAKIPSPPSLTKDQTATDFTTAQEANTSVTEMDIPDLSLSPQKRSPSKQAEPMDVSQSQSPRRSQRLLDVSNLMEAIEDVANPDTSKLPWEISSILFNISFEDKKELLLEKEEEEEESESSSLPSSPEFTSTPKQNVVRLGGHKRTSECVDTTAEDSSLHSSDSDSDSDFDPKKSHPKKKASNAKSKPKTKPKPVKPQKQKQPTKKARKTSPKKKSSAKKTHTVSSLQDPQPSTSMQVIAQPTTASPTPAPPTPAPPTPVQPTLAQPQPAAEPEKEVLIANCSQTRVLLTDKDTFVFQKFTNPDGLWCWWTCPMALVIRGFHLVSVRNHETMNKARRPTLQTNDIDLMIIEMSKLTNCFTFKSQNLIDSFCRKYKTKIGGIFDYPQILQHYQTPDGEFFFKLNLLKEAPAIDVTAQQSPAQPTAAQPQPAAEPADNECLLASMLHPEVNLYTHRTGCVTTPQTPVGERNKRTTQGCITLYRLPRPNVNTGQMETISDLLKEATQSNVEFFFCGDLHPDCSKDNFLDIWKDWHPPLRLPMCRQNVTKTTQTTYTIAPELLPIVFDRNVVADGPHSGRNDLELDMEENDYIYLPMHDGTSQEYHLVGTIQHSGKKGLPIVQSPILNHVSFLFQDPLHLGTLSLILDIPMDQEPLSWLMI